MKLLAARIGYWIMALVGAGHLVAQPGSAVPTNRAYDALSSRQEIKAYAATNDSFGRAIEYFVQTMDGHQPDKLPEGLALEDISRAVLKAFPGASYTIDQPIRFYGKVLDENDQPVPGAVIRFEWEGFLIQRKATIDVNSDQAGLFALTDKTGTQLYVSVGKDGYYTSPRNGGAGILRYAAAYGQVFRPDPGQPVLYYLHKKGEPAKSLVTSQYGVRQDYWVQAPLDRTKVSVNLLERKTGSGSLEISQVKPEYAKWKAATAWSFAMKIPSGGFIVEAEEFPFRPPETGYQPEVAFSFEKGATNWTTDVRKDYYFKFGNPAMYGRLHLETSISTSYAILGYVINPDGSRNLEPKQ
jgi:hypothetical protein